MQAEAAAQEKIQRASGFRRLATGAAIAMVAVGLGFGLYLAKREMAPGRFPPAQDEGQQAAVEPKADVRRPNNDSGYKSDERLPQDSVDDKKEDKRGEENKDGFDTTNFDIFRTRELEFGNRKWSIEAGHRFATEADQQNLKWIAAWCYTTVLAEGITVNVDLGARLTTASTQSRPGASAETLAKTDLTEFDALTLATKCPWLDNRSFDIDEIEGPTRISKPQFKMVDGTLVYSGPIEGGFASALAKQSFDVLEINSPGGLIDEALTAGRLLRMKRKLVRTRQECLSACVFVLAGGAIREAENKAHIGVHRFFKNSNADIGDIEFAQEKSADIVQYLQGMGVSNDLWLAMAKTPSQSMKYIDHEQLRAWRLLSPPVTDIPDDPFQPENQSTDSPSQDSKKPGLMMYRIPDVDAPGHDLPDMPILEMSEVACELMCSTTSECVAATYNIGAQACFLKSAITRIQTFKSAVTFYRPALHGKFHVDVTGTVE